MVCIRSWHLVQRARLLRRRRFVGNARALGTARLARDAAKALPRWSKAAAITASTRCWYRCAAAATPTTRRRRARAAELLRQPDDFDPLATVLEAGHAAGLRVHAWVNVNLVSSAAELPSAREHIVSSTSCVADGARATSVSSWRASKPDSPAYVGTLARWTRTQSTEIEGLYLSPIAPEAVDYTGGDRATISYVATRSTASTWITRDIRAIASTTAAPRSANFAQRSTAAARRTRARVRSMLRSTEDLVRLSGLARRSGGAEFRVSRMKALIMRVCIRPSKARAAGRAWSAWPSIRTPARPSGTAAGLAPHGRERSRRRDVPDGLHDRRDEFAEQIARCGQLAGSRPVWAGIGAYRLSAKETIDNIVTARRLGAERYRPVFVRQPRPRADVGLGLSVRR